MAGRPAVSALLLEPVSSEAEADFGGRGEWRVLAGRVVVSVLADLTLDFYWRLRRVVDFAWADGGFGPAAGACFGEGGFFGSCEEWIFAGGRLFRRWIFWWLRRMVNFGWADDGIGAASGAYFGGGG